MDNSFELASTTAVTPETLRATDTRRIRGNLFNYYVQRNPTAAPAALLGQLSDVATLEEQVRHLSGRAPELFTLANIFRASLKPPQVTDVPGHGTVSDVGIADGELGVHSNLLVEGTLIVAGDLSVGGQMIVGPDACVVVTGSIHTSALSSSGQVCVGKDLRAMFVEVQGDDVSLDVSGLLDSFLLIQNDQVARATDYSVGLHAVYPRADAAAEVFLRGMLGRDGKPDWTAIARAAQAAEDVFKADYSTPEPAAGTWVQVLR